MNARSHDLVEIRDISLRFGGVTALDRVSFTVPKGAIVGLIGPNGAGKTTLFNCLSRIYQPTDGEILFSGKSIQRLPPQRMVSLGIGRTFQNIALFRSMSVRENIAVGAHCYFRGTFLSDALGLARLNPGNRAQANNVEKLIELLNLGRDAERRVNELPFGTQKRVELARALAARPQLLLLDEPACGLNHEEVEGLKGLLLEIQRSLQLTLLLVEHHMSLVMSLSDKVVALDFGKKIADGTPAEVQKHPDVVRAYLGSEDV